MSLIQLPSTTESLHPLSEAWEFHTLSFLCHESVKSAEMLYLRGAHRGRRRGSGGPRFAPGHEPGHQHWQTQERACVSGSPLSGHDRSQRSFLGNEGVWLAGAGWSLQQEDPRGGVTLWDVNGEKEQKWTDEEKEGA